MQFKVYEVTSEVKERILTSQQKQNIEIIFNDLIGEQVHTSHLKRMCILPQNKQTNEAVLYDYNNNKDNYDFTKIAEKLLESELTKRGSRSKNISEGFLFIKKEREKLFLIKIEKTDIVDTETFEKRNELGTDKNYYKVCVFNNNYDNIVIIDKNKQVAKYWYSEFLDLEFQRNDEDNTFELIELIENNQIFSDEIKQSDRYSEIIQCTKEYIFSNSEFDKSELYSSIKKCTTCYENSRPLLLIKK